MQWRYGYGQEVSDASAQRAFREVVDLSWLTDGLQEGELVEVAPSPPPRLILAADSDVLPDFGFVRISNQPVQELFIPCAEQLTSGKLVCILGFASRPTPDWARNYLRTEADYEEKKLESQFKHQKDPPLNWELGNDVALKRVLDLFDGVCYPNKLVVAPGTVAAASPRIIAHTCSSLPGMSSGPGVDIQHPWKLLFVHTRADADFRQNINYGYSVNHLLFVKAYMREVLPQLLATPVGMFKPGMAQTLHQYLTAHSDELDDAEGLLKRVAQLM